MSIAERLRKKNQELLATTNDNNNSSSSASSTGAGGRSWQRSNLTSNSTSSTSSDTGDTKDLQRKLDQAVKEVEEYKSKYEKLKKEKEELEKQLSQYKEDIDKVQELKSDNIRLKDENGALIRVISKLSRTPASSSSWAVQWALMGVRHDYIFKIKKERFYTLFIELLLKLMMWAAEAEFFYTLLCLVGTSELVVSQGLR